MSLVQPGKVVPPLLSDPRLVAFAQIIQSAFGTLYQAAHVHAIVSVEPSDRTGNPGDIYLFDDGTNIYLYIKTGRGWAKSSGFTLI